jgi:hypothetical protein
MANNLTWEEKWSETETLLGRVVFKWGAVMGLVYGLPKDMEFENADAIRLGLASSSGDGSRIQHMRDLLSHTPALFPSNPERTEKALVALKTLSTLIKKRDALIHGVPVWSFKRDLGTKEVLRRGAYLVQQRKWNEGERFLKVPEAVQEHLSALDAAHLELQKVAKPMLFEDWDALFAGLPDEART